MIKRLLLTITVITLFTVSCTKLNENLNGQLTESQVGGGGTANTAALLNGIYDRN